MKNDILQTYNNKELIVGYDNTNSINSNGVTPNTNLFIATTNSNSISNNNLFNITTTAECSYFDPDQYKSYMKEMRVIYYYLTEDELLELINKVKSRINDEEKNGLKEFVKLIVKTRHFSEKFILDNIEYLTKEDIEIMHEADICSGSYEQLKLMFIAGN